MVMPDSFSDSDSSEEAEANVDWLAVVRGEPSGTGAVVHEGFFCDGCAEGGSEPRPIVGVRYTRKGDEYDLCNACFIQLPSNEKRRYTALKEALPVDSEIKADSDTSAESDDEEDSGTSGSPRHTRTQSTDSLDAKIASLEAMVERQDSSSSSSDSSDDEGVDAPVHGSSNNSDVAAIPELERIQPLSQESLPEFYRKSKARKGNAAAAEAAVSVAAAAIGYEKAEKRSLYCRVCKQQFETLEALQQHRATPEHEAAQQRDKDGSYCPLCDKQFTSPDQLREHVRGKWHQARETAALKGQKFVAPGKKAKRRGRTSNRKVTSGRAPGGGTLGAKIRAAQEPQKKPLVVRFGTETGGQIKVKGRKKVLGGLREQPAAETPGKGTETTQDARLRHESGSGDGNESQERATSAQLQKHGKLTKRQRVAPV